MSVGVATPIREGRRFRFLECIGAGGFGEVYLAEMISSGGVTSRVAVKLLLAGVDPRSSPVERLRDEGRLLGLLDHPVILRVTDLVELDGRAALVTQFVDGCDLELCLRGPTPIPVGPLLEVLGHVAGALHHAWSAPGPEGTPLELVHRDIKPSNIRIGRHGEVKLLDFGIARANTAVREAKTREGLAMGTREYMSPERFDDDAAVGPASDVFALGCTLYEGIAHSSLFADVKTNTHFAIAADEERFRSFVEKRVGRLEVDEPIRQLVADMLAFDPAARPSADQVRSRCERLSRHLEPTLRDWVRDWAWPARRPRSTPLVGRTLSEADVSESPAVAPSPVSGPVSGTIATATGSTTRPMAIAAAGLVSVTGLGAVAFGLVALVIAGVAVWTSRDVKAPAATPEPAPAPVASAPAPEPAEPVPAAVPAPLPAPPRGRPAPVAPAVEPVAAPAPAPAKTQILGPDVPVELRGAAGVFPPGPVPAGTYDVWADFGEGLRQAGSVAVSDGATVRLKCSRMKNLCFGGDP